MEPQLKRWAAVLLGGLIIILILIRTLGLFRLPLVQVDAFEAVPSNAALIFEIKDWQKTSNRLMEATYADDLESMPIFNKLRSDLTHLDSLFLQTEKDRHILRAGRIVAAAQLSKSDDIDLVYLIDKYRKNIDLQQFARSLEGVDVRESTFKHHKIFELNGDDGFQFTISTFKGLVIASRHTFLVEFAISQLKNVSTNISRDPGFRKAEQLAGNSGDIAVFLNFENLPLLGSGFVKAEKEQSLASLSGIMSWMSLDLYFQPETIVTNGYGIPLKSNAFWQGILKQQPPEQFYITEALPNHTAIASCFGFRDLRAWFKWVSSEQTDQFKDYFLPWIGDEFAYVVTEPLSENIDEEQFLVLSIGNDMLASEIIPELIAETGEISSNSYQNYTISQMQGGNLALPIFDKNQNLGKSPFIVMLDKYVVLGNSLQGMKKWIDKYNFGQTLGRDPAFIEFESQLPIKSNYYLYLNPSRLFQVFKSHLKSGDPELLTQKFKTLQKFSPIEFKWSSHNSMLLTSGHVGYAISGSQPASILWKTELDEPAVIPPSFVRNDKNGDLEIFIQDASNRVYLIGKNGNVRWTREVDGPIISEIQQVDLYKNDKLQSLFNTKDKIWCFDREGGDVKGKGYPKRTREVINGVFVADYDGEKDYRLFVARKNRGIYAFKKNGERLSGWSPRERTGDVYFPIRHFVVEEKDYLVSLNDEGELHAFARNSNRRFPPVKFNAKFNSSFGVDVASKPYRVVACDEDGIAYVTNLSGDHFTLNLDPGKRKNVKFAFADVVEDERKDYITLSEDVLVVNDHDKRIYTHEFEEPQDEVFALQINEGGKANIGTVSKSTRKIYLLDEAGNPYPEFPLAGTTRFVVGDPFGDGSNILVVANGAVVYAYRLE